MRLRDEITIPLPPEEVWQHIGNPARWLGFHPKVTAVRPSGDAEPVLGNLLAIRGITRKPTRNAGTRARTL